MEPSVIVLHGFGGVVRYPNRLESLSRPKHCGDGGKPGHAFGVDFSYRHRRIRNGILEAGVGLASPLCSPSAQEWRSSVELPYNRDGKRSPLIARPSVGGM